MLGIQSASTAVRRFSLECILSKLPMQRFQPLQSVPLWNGCGRPTAVHDCVIVKHRARQVITAIRTMENQLRLFSWRVNANGTASCTGTNEVPAENVAQVDLVRARTYISGWRTFDGTAHLQCWDASNTGALYANGAATQIADNYTWFHLLVLATDRLLTIGLTTAGMWQLITWAINDESTLQQLHSTILPATTGSFAATLLQPSIIQPTAAERPASPIQFVTVRHSRLQQLQWTRWLCSHDGQMMIEEETTVPYSTVIDLAMTTVDGELVTVLQRGDGKLEALHGWPTKDEGGKFSQDGQRAENRITTLAEDVRLFSLTHDAAQLTVAYVRTHTTAAQDVRSPRDIGIASFPASTTVQMHRWQPRAAQWVTVGSGTIPIATASELAFCNEPLDGNAPFLTAIGTTAGALHLVTWSDLHQHQFN